MMEHRLFVKVVGFVTGIAIVVGIVPIYKTFAAPERKNSGLCAIAPFESALTKNAVKTDLKKLDADSRKLFESAYLYGKDKSRTELEADIKTLAQARKESLRQAMRTDPEAALGMVLLPSSQATVSALVADCIEHSDVAEGTLEIIYADRFEQGESTIEHVLTTAKGERVRLNLAGEPNINLTSGLKLRVQGYKLDHDLLINATDPAAIKEVKSFSLFGTQAAAYVPHAFGPQNTIVVLARFQNTSLTTSAEWANQVIFGDVNDYYTAISDGQTTIQGTVIGPYDVPLPAGTCDLTTIRNAVIAATDADVYYPDYSRLVIIFPAGCGTAWGTVGQTSVSTADGAVTMSTAWMSNGTISTHNVGHELGHNFGMNHGSYYDCSPELLPANTGLCSKIEYGDSADIMGGSGTNGSATAMSGVHQDMIGWLNASQAIQATSGEYTLVPIEATSTGTKVLRIPRAISGSNTSYLWVEYHQPIGYDANMYWPAYHEGALLRIDQAPSTYSYLFSTQTPGSRTDPALKPGNSFVDPLTGTQVTTVSATPEALTVQVVQGKSDFTAPTASITSPAPYAEISGTTTITADASDAESGIQKVEFYVAGKLVGTDYDAPYSVEVDTTHVLNGNVSIYASAYDRSGEAYGVSSNRGNSPTQSNAVVNIDSVPPTITIVSPADNSTATSSVSVTIDASDNVGLYTVQLFKDGSIAKVFNPATAGQPPYTTTLTFSTLGTHTIYAATYDFVRNVSSTTITITVVDDIAPTTAITSPLNNAKVPRNSTVNIAATASDNMAVSRVEFYVNGALKCTDTTASYSCAWLVPSVRNATYQLQTKAYDAYENVGVSPVITVMSK